MKWLHRKCSWVNSSLQAASAAYNARSGRKTQETPPPAMVEEGLVVGGEKCNIVDSFCYLGDVLITEGGADAAVTASVQEAGTFFNVQSTIYEDGGRGLHAA